MAAAMTKEAKAARAAYMRAWRKKNPEKVREYDAAKWQKIADRQAAEREAKENAESEA